MNIDFSIGLHIVGFLASQNGKPLTSVLMAKSYGTNPVVLRRVLTRLNQSNIVETKRGVGGGTILARSSHEITLREVYQSVCKNVELFSRHPTNDGPVSSVLGGYINLLYCEAEQLLLAHLETITVANMDSVVGPQIEEKLNCC